MLIMSVLYITQMQLGPLKDNHNSISNTKWTVLHLLACRQVHRKQFIIIRVTIY